MVPLSAASDTSTLEFITWGSKNKKPLSQLTPNTYYFYNGMDDSNQSPVVQKDGTVTYVGAKALDPVGTLTKYHLTASEILRVIKIPENAPTAIQCSFLARIKKTPVDGSWASDKKSPPNIDIKFATDSFSGGGITVGENELQPAGEWKEQNIRLNVPKGAQYLTIKLSASGGDEIDLGNWTIQ
jgi:hypothetical protein